MAEDAASSSQVIRQRYRTPIFFRIPILFVVLFKCYRSSSMCP